MRLRLARKIANVFPNRRRHHTYHRAVRRTMRARATDLRRVRRARR